MADKCESCGCTEEKKLDGTIAPVELRPYGVGGAKICFACGMKDPQRTEREAEKRMRGNVLLTGEGPIPYVGKLPG